MSVPSVTKIAGWVVATNLAWAGVTAGQTPVPASVPAAIPDLAAIDAELRHGDWEAARTGALARIAGELSGTDAAELAPTVARLALAEAGQDRVEDAVWHWYVAQNLQRDVLSPAGLTAYGPPGELLARHPLRQMDEPPAGLSVLRSEDRSLEPGRRIAGTLPTLTAYAATSALTAPLGFRLQAVIDTDGRVLAPVVIAGGSPGMTYEVLEALRSWRYQPARKKGLPVAVFRSLTINAPGTSHVSAGFSDLDRLLRNGQWKDAHKSAEKLWTATLNATGAVPQDLAPVLVLRAVADAGVGRETEAVCRWQAAQYLDPGLQSADLSVYGRPGDLLASHRWNGAAGYFGEHDAKPEIRTRNQPDYPATPLREMSLGSIELGATIGADGAVRQPFVLRVRSGNGIVLHGLAPGMDGSISPYRAAMSRLLAISALDALCGWRLSPGRAQGEAADLQRVVSVAYVSLDKWVPKVGTGMAPSRTSIGPGGFPVDRKHPPGLGPPQPPPPP